MGKRVLTRRDLEEVYYGGGRTVLLERDCVVPPGVMDLARSLGVRLLRFGTPQFEEALGGMLSDMGLEGEALKAVRSRLSELLGGGDGGKKGGLDLEG